MSAAEPLVTVVTPVYNGEQYLVECIESVLGQTYEQFKYLIVDNCSTDATLEIARRYEDADPRIRVLAPRDFVSGDANANRALREIEPDSRYVKIVHADDSIYPECIAKMTALAQQHPSVGVVASYRRLGDAVVPRRVPESPVVSGREVALSTLLGTPYDYLFGSPTTLLLRADLVRARPEFYNVTNPFDADVEACLDLLRECDFGFVHEELTFTRRHESAASSYFFRNGAQRPAAIERVLKFGPLYLERNEYERKLAVVVAEYVRFMMMHLAKLRSAEFREFHREVVFRLGRQIPVTDLVRGAARQVLVSGRRLRRAAPAA